MRKTYWDYSIFDYFDYAEKDSGSYSKESRKDK